MRYAISFFIFDIIIMLFLWFPTQAKWIIGFILASIIGVVIYLISTYDERQEKYMKDKFGEDYKEKIKEKVEQEGFGFMTTLPCKPDPTFVSKSTIEKKAKVSLPNFVVTGCSESLHDFTGDFRGEAIIEFDEVISDRIIEQIETEMKRSYSKWSKGVITTSAPSEWREDEDLYICDLSIPIVGGSSNGVFWSISIRRNSKEGTIIYGRI